MREVKKGSANYEKTWRERQRTEMRHSSQSKKEIHRKKNLIQILIFLLYNALCTCTWFAAPCVYTCKKLSCFMLYYRGVDFQNSGDFSVLKIYSGTEDRKCTYCQHIFTVLQWLEMCLGMKQIAGLKDATMFPNLSYHLFAVLKLYSEFCFRMEQLMTEIKHKDIGLKEAAEAKQDLEDRLDQMTRVTEAHR